MTGLKKESNKYGGRHGMLSQKDIWTLEIPSQIATILFLKILAMSWVVNESVGESVGGCNGEL